MTRLFVALTLAAIALVAASTASAFEYLGEEVEVVDMHLHPGDFGALNPEGKAFIVSGLPPFTRLYYPAVAQAVLDPYAEHVGIQSQIAMADAHHAVLFAVYTHHTTGYFTNEDLEQMLIDPRNVTPDGDTWAWGMASINYDDFDNEQIRESRYAALASYFEQRPDLFIGIKLAHAHQGVTFDDEVYLGVYDIAAEFGAPVLLHTGFSPFPNTETTPEYYDPAGLEQVIRNYDGEAGPRVDFVLSHVGQGDPRSVEHALALAEDYDNVWLEVSALGRPTLLDADGESTEATEPQLPYVMQEILDREIVDRALFASDGPQFSGMVAGYLDEVAGAMETAGYSVEQAEAVLSGNFFTLYGVGGE